MATGYVQQDVVFIQGGQATYQVDLTQPAIAVAKRVADYRAYSWTAVWSGSPQGTLQAVISNAGERQDQLVGNPNWVALGPDATLEVGQGATPDTSPAGISILFNASGWAAVSWTPAQGAPAGTMNVQFDGVRR